jgi:hypothetical protein
VGAAGEITHVPLTGRADGRGPGQRSHVAAPSTLESRPSTADGAPPTGRLRSTSWLVDGHAHLYECYDVEQFLNGAAANFASAARTLGLPSETIGCLMLAETATDEAFTALRSGRLALPSPWTLRTTAEDVSVILCWRGTPRLVVIAGRQIVTEENLEVLALGCRRTFVERKSTDLTVADVIAAEGIAVVPWGFGKWWGRRKAVVNRVVARSWAGRLFLGDNAGRPRLGHWPQPFAAAQSNGIWVLPGTDTLPFRDQAARAGRYGVVLDIPFDISVPATRIRERLINSAVQPMTYGRLERLGTCVAVQLRMQFRRRRG